MQLYPLEEYVVARGLEDHTDSTTYYVRAVIRNAKTDAVIATLDLTDQGDSHRFKKTWQVPADPTGLGFWITIVSSVYSDSGYTTKAPNYGDKYEEKFIEARLNNHGGGVDVDYTRVRKIVKEELAHLPTPEQVTIPPVDFSPLSDALRAILSEVRAIKLPEAAKVDLMPVLAKIASVEAAVKAAIAAIHIPEPLKTDLEPVLAELKKVDFLTARAEVQTLLANLNDASKVLDKVKKFFLDDVEQIKQGISKLLDMELQTEIQTVGPNYQFQKTPITIKRKTDV